MRRTRITMTLAVVVVAGMLLSGCSAQNNLPAKSAGPATETLTLASSVDINSFAPADSRDAFYVQYYQPVYDSLLKLQPNGDYTAMLATKWKYNAAKTVLHLDLRRGVKFSDGTAFNADAVKANLEATKGGTGTSSAAFASISSIVADSASSVDITLKQPDPGIIRQLALPGGMMASPKALNTPGLKTMPVGSGPYTLDESKTTPTVQYTFVANPTYWDKNAVKFKTIVIKPILDGTARFNAVRSGQVDASPGDALNADQAKGAGLTVTQSPGPGFQGLFLFDRDGAIVPALKDVRVRQALNHALDRKGILQALNNGAGTVTEQVFNPKSLVWDKSLNDTYPYNPKKARTLLKAAGFADGFSISIPQPVFPNLQPLLDQELGAVGIKVDWVAVPNQSTNDEYLSGKFAAVWYQLQSSDPWQGINFWGSPTAPWNPLKSTDPEITAAIAKIQTASGNEQVKDYKSLAKLYVDKAWFVPAYFPDAVYFSSSKVQVKAQALQIVPSIYNYSPAS